MPPYNPMPILEDWRTCGAFAHGILRYDGWMALVELEAACGSVISAICDIQYNRVAYAVLINLWPYDRVTLYDRDGDLAHLTIRWPRELEGREEEIIHKLFRRAY